MSVSLPQIPPELRRKIFQEISHDNILNCLQIDQWRGIILEYLNQQARRARKDPRFYPLLDKLIFDRGEIFKYFNYQSSQFQREMPELTPWSIREPTAWYLSARQILRQASECVGEYCDSTITSHTPLHNIRLNSNLVCYVRNDQVGIWRRSTQSGTFIEPHGVNGFHSWTCKTNIELLLTEKFLVTAVADIEPEGQGQGRFKGSISVKAHATSSMEVFWEVQSEYLMAQPSVQLHSVADNGTVLLSVWDRADQSNGEEEGEEDARLVSYFAMFANSHQLHHLDQVRNSVQSQSKLYIASENIYKIMVERQSKYFGRSALSVRVMQRVGGDFCLLASKQLFSAPVDFGLFVENSNQVFFWIYDQLMFQLFSLANVNVPLYKHDLRCKTSFCVHNSVRECLILSQWDPVRRALQIFKLSMANELSVQKVAIPSADVFSVHIHDSCFACHSEDRLNIHVIDYLQPFLH